MHAKCGFDADCLCTELEPIMTANDDDNKGPVYDPVAVSSDEGNTRYSLVKPTACLTYIHMYKVHTYI